MIICLVLHLVRIFVQGAYKYPRELTWIVGVGLLAATIGFGFTGYLLPWDQRAFWATTVGTEIAGGVPVIGDALLQLLRGGADVTDATLSRFFGMHVLVLPLTLGALLVVHLTIVHQLGLANPKRPEPRPGRASAAVDGGGREAQALLPPLRPRRGHRLGGDARGAGRPGLGPAGRPGGQGEPARDAGPRQAGVVLPVGLPAPQDRAA